MAKHTILFLTANPANTERLAIDREAHAIHEALERRGVRAQVHWCRLFSPNFGHDGALPE
jgi:hypothetical protein